MRKFFGGLLMVIGLVIALASGLCSLAMIFGSMTSQNGHINFGNGAGAFLLALPFGGIPFLAGLSFIGLGRQMWKKKETEEKVS